MNKMYFCFAFLIAVGAIVYLSFTGNIKYAGLFVPALVYCVVSFFSKGVHKKPQTTKELALFCGASTGMVTLVLLVLYALGITCSFLVPTAIGVQAVSALLCWRSFYLCHKK